jgi:hypothetical protein
VGSLDVESLMAIMDGINPFLEEGMTDRTSAAVFESVGHQDDERIQRFALQDTAADIDAAFQGARLRETAEVPPDSESASDREQGSFADDTALEIETPDLQL